MSMQAMQHRPYSYERYPLWYGATQGPTRAITRSDMGCFCLGTMCAEGVLTQPDVLLLFEAEAVNMALAQLPEGNKGGGAAVTSNQQVHPGLQLSLIHI